MRRPLSSFLLASLLLLTACVAGPAEVPPATPPRTSTSEPTLAAPAPAKTLAPTRVPTRQPEPTPTLGAIPASYELPAWLSDPQANVLMNLTSVSRDERRISFFEAATGSSFDLPLADAQGYFYFWMPDGQHFGLLSKDNESLYLISVASGDVTRFEAGDDVTRFLYFVGFDVSPSPPMPLFPSGSAPEDEPFLLVSNMDRLSADGRYIVLSDINQRFTSLEDLVTGQATQVTDPEDDLFDIEFAWSPISQQLAVLQSTHVPGLGVELGDRMLNLYDPATGARLASYTGNFSWAQWSPDGTRILYTRVPGAHFSRAGDLCILELASGLSQCLDRLDEQHGGARIGFFQWSPDGMQVSYLYWGSEGTGGLCVIDLVTEGISCPTDNVAELVGTAVIRYKWSPNGRYFVLTYDNDGCPDCDYSGDRRSAFVAVDGSNSYLLDEESLFFALWQPVPPDSAGSHRSRGEAAVKRLNRQTFIVVIMLHA